MIRLSLALLFLFTISATPVPAFYDPLSRVNNKYGIHIIDENDLMSAAALVNSSGGDWGYVTLVIPENERKQEKWQTAFNEMRRLHWPIKNRYVIIFNEPNHRKEWGGELDPTAYADILDKFISALSNKSEDFFILPAGFDASAANTGDTMDEAAYLKAMAGHKKSVFEAIDGWTSHSYPNPHFLGLASDRGRGTVSNFIWELNLLKSWGIERNLPIFITETGWPHNEAGANYLYSPETISDFINETAGSIWTDERIAAITPFVLNYQSFPFVSFSWQKLNSDKFYTHFDTYRSLLKIRGEPLFNLEEPTPTIQKSNPQTTSLFQLFRYAIFPFRQILKLI
ncbi:MAG: hypothetical protein UV09_C0018G0022 [Candidatus Gottesmanbacteria bacterium GW2011_GWA2_42_18]|uniref:Asl1-like glycosyl hydrolase catalytic domain-containing protein n=1 Tax=Candidatus Gottesmanbacteria bacterium GW2011_GWA2_42_18 TaxID=1618442 RepID=A0A0G1BJ93_9BACT|nr:MAG: hypothetical protein UV09_C0018G0022 [Candidatus Gottesmanbacteria bacterium GW2011_GWA2_42_18]